MFSRVLVANRGEIALRVVRALREMGIESVVAYSQTDKDTRAVQEADIAVCIGPAPSAKSYLNFAAVIGAAVSRACQAVHPGYGFLSENSDFARACADNDLVFIGPSADVIDRMGEIFIVESKSVAAYLRQIGKMGEDPEDYASIWAYTRGETEPRFGLYEYPGFDFGVTDRMSNLEL